MHFTFLSHICQYTFEADMSVKTDIKTILAESDVTITKVADEISRITGKRCTQSNISQKLSRGTLKYEEAKLIGQNFGLRIEICQNKILYLIGFILIQLRGHNCH